MAFLGPERRRPTMYYSSCRLRPRMRAGFMVMAAEGDRGEPAISFVCSYDSTSKRALERAWSRAANVLRLLLQQYVQESFGALGGHG